MLANESGAIGQQPLRAAAVRIGTRIFEGPTHADAFDAAMRAGIPESAAEDGTIGFTTRAGRFVDRMEATKLVGMNPNVGLFDASGLGESGRIGAYHGSPHKFPAFSMEKIGTGQGAQSYSRGLYFSENPAVAEDYRLSLGGERLLLDGQPVENLNTDIPEHAAINSVSSQGVKNALKGAQEMLDRETMDNPNFNRSWFDRYVAAVKNLEGHSVTREPTGMMYKVSIDADPTDFLDWDKALHQQSPKVQDALRELLPKRYGPITAEQVPDGQGLYYLKMGGQTLGTFPADKIAEAEQNWLRYVPLKGQNVIEGVGRWPAEGAPRIEDQLLQSGIKGVRYLDQGSRDFAHLEVVPSGNRWAVKDKGFEAYYDTEKEALAAAHRTYNYVVYDDKIIQILNSGLSGTAMMAALVGAGLTATAAAKLIEAHHR